MTSRPGRRGLALLASAGLAAGLVPALGTPALAITRSEVDEVATGLDSPRGIAYVDGEGDAPDLLFVAEGGTGGEGPCVPAGDPEDPQDPDSPAPELCYGPTGAITMVDLSSGEQRRVVTELPSLALDLAEGDEAIGPQDVSVVPGSYDGTTVSLRIVVGLGAPEAARESLGEEGALFGTLVAVDVDVTAQDAADAEDWTVIADIAQFEYDNDPVPADEDMDGETDAPDSNPHSVLALGDTTLVVDAGGNTLVAVDESTPLPLPLPGNEPTYEVTLAEKFPMDREAEAPEFIGAPPGTMIPYQPVPTSIAQVADGPDEGTEGDLLVTELTGFPFPAGEARVYEVDADPDTPPGVRVDGLSSGADVAQRGDDLFVAEFAHGSLLFEPPGAVVRVRPEGGHQALLLDQGLHFPGGVVVDADGIVYVTNNGISADEGQVLSFDPSAAGDPALAAACDPDEVTWPEFDDIEMTVHEEAIACLASRGVVKGVDADTYDPAGVISRAQAASLVARLLDETDAPVGGTTTDFFDDDEGVHEDNINRLAAAGIVAGRSARKYEPTLDLTRGQIASLAVRAYEEVAGPLPAGGNAFTDDDHSTHSGAIEKAAAAGWVSGYGGGLFGPDDEVTRAQAATILARALADLVEAGHAE